MKQYINRIISIILVISIVFISFFLCPFSVYASGDHGGGNHSGGERLSPEEIRLRKQTILDNAEKYLLFLISELGAYVNDGSFYDYYTNFVEFEQSMGVDYFLDQNITVEDDGCITYSQDLVASIKQALQEYADETNPFKIQPTYSYKSIPAGLFPSKQTYNAFTSYCASHYMVAFSFRTQVSNLNDNMLLGDVSEVVDDGGGFVAIGSYGFYTVNPNWSRAPVWRDYYIFSKDENGEYIVSSIQERSQQCTDFLNYDATNATFRKSSTTGYLVTKDGGRVRVFNSLAEFKDYNAGQRKVYFGSDFYDYTPAEITATWDEISDTLDHMDDILQQLLDKITDSTDESEIEDLLQQILDAILNGGGSGSGSGGIGGVISGWYEDVLLYLDKILKQLKSIKRWTVIDTFIDGIDAIADWLDLIHDILSDVDDGMESAVSTLSSALDDATGLLKGKFPFSVPWDIFFFVTLLAAEPETPYFEVPIDFDVSSLGMHIHYDFVVDFSGYQYLSDIFRVVLSMTYAVGLMKMTAGIVSTKKEE